MRRRTGFTPSSPATPQGDQARVIGSLTRFLLAPDDPEAVLSALAAPTTRIVSLTITEGGYNIDDPDRPAVAFDILTQALARRREERNWPRSPCFPATTCSTTATWPGRRF